MPYGATVYASAANSNLIKLKTRVCAKSRDGASGSNVRPVIVTSNVVLYSRFSGNYFIYMDLN